MFKKINLEIPFLCNHFDLKKVIRTSKFKPTELISTELLDLITRLELVAVNSLVIFYPSNIKNSSIHIDDHDVYDQTNLNLVVNASSSSVNWYLPIEGYNGVLSINMALKRDYEIDKMNLVESAIIEGPCIIQGGIPHNVSNLTGQRWCVSVKLKTTDMQHLNWKDALIKFDKFIIDNDRTEN
jgi:hypothetical protein